MRHVALCGAVRAHTVPRSAVLSDPPHDR